MHKLGWEYMRLCSVWYVITDACSVENWFAGDNLDDTMGLKIACYFTNIRLVIPNKAITNMSYVTNPFV